MKEFVACILIATFAVLLGTGIGISHATQVEQKKLGTAICKKLNGTFARLDGDPICVNAAGGILKFYD